MPEISVNGETIHYERAGQGPTLAMLHSLGTNSYLWKEQIERWQDKFTCVAFDARGHGRSTTVARCAVLPRSSRPPELTTTRAASRLAGQTRDAPSRGHPARRARRGPTASAASPSSPLAASPATSQPHPQLGSLPRCPSTWGHSECPLDRKIDRARHGSSFPSSAVHYCTVQRAQRKGVMSPCVRGSRVKASRFVRIESIESR